MTDKRTLEISEDLVQAIEDHLSELSAGSVSEYVEALLRTALTEAGYLAPYSAEEEAEVERRLRDLGYID
ncbi:hypothetical protein J7J55_05440 [Candidatus Bipolaricaulota bacterium]|jgi:Arc/MetJ-type ribon-helix-helix transcriptional regulator|nr:hypothetical protein [Candidatus Bipolaricaulota bacterium]